MIKKILSFTFLAIILALVGIFVVVTYDVGGILKNTFEKKSSEYLKVDVNIGRIDISPLKGHLAIYDLKIHNPKEYDFPYFFEAPKLSAYFNIFSFLNKDIKIKDVSIESPNLYIEFHLKGNNFRQIMKNLQGEASTIKAGDHDAPQEVDANKKFVTLDHLFIKDLNLHTRAEIVEANLTLDEMHINNIGKDDRKLLFSQALLVVLEQIYKETIKANIKHPSINIDKTLKNVKESFKNTEGRLKEFLK